MSVDLGGGETGETILDYSGYGQEAFTITPEGHPIKQGVAQLRGDTIIQQKVTLPAGKYRFSWNTVGGSRDWTQYNVSDAMVVYFSLYYSPDMTGKHIYSWWSYAQSNSEGTINHNNKANSSGSLPYYFDFNFYTETTIYVRARCEAWIAGNWDHKFSKSVVYLDRFSCEIIESYIDTIPTGDVSDVEIALLARDVSFVRLEQSPYEVSDIAAGNLGTTGGGFDYQFTQELYDANNGYNFDGIYGGLNSYTTQSLKPLPYLGQNHVRSLTWSANNLEIGATYRVTVVLNYFNWSTVHESVPPFISVYGGDLKANFWADHIEGEVTEIRNLTPPSHDFVADQNQHNISISMGKVYRYLSFISLLELRLEKV